MILFRTIKWYLNFVITLVVMFPKILQLEKIKDTTEISKFDDEVFDITKTWAKKQLDAAGVNVIVTGSKNLPTENVLFVSNHQGNFDIPLLMVYATKPKGFIAKKSLESFPIVNRYMYLMNSLFLDRDNVKEAGKVIIKGINILKEGHSLVIFPEGTRAKSSTMGEFKSGATKLAIKSKVKIVPISIEGTYKIMEENNNKIVPQTVRMHIHEAIDTTNLTKEEENGLSDKLRDIIQNKVIELQSIN